MMRPPWPDGSEVTSPKALSGEWPLRSPFIINALRGGLMIVGQTGGDLSRRVFTSIEMPGRKFGRSPASSLSPYWLSLRSGGVQSNH